MRLADLGGDDLDGDDGGTRKTSRVRTKVGGAYNVFSPFAKA